MEALQNLKLGAKFRLFI